MYFLEAWEGFKTLSALGNPLKLSKLDLFNGFISSEIDSEDGHINNNVDRRFHLSRTYHVCPSMPVTLRRLV